MKLLSNRYNILLFVMLAAGLTLIGVALASPADRRVAQPALEAGRMETPTWPTLPPAPGAVAADAPPSTPTAAAAEPVGLALESLDLGFSGEAAMRHVEAQMAFGPRPTGSEALRRTAEYILSYLAGLGWQTEARPFVYQGVEGQNLVARAGRAGGPVLLLGAHYDTRREADRDPLTPWEPVPGANDGASGVAVLMELARVLDLTAVQGEVWLVFFDAEDNGGLDGWEYIAGSRIFADTMEIEPAYMILVDMVGDADQQLYYETNSDRVLSQHLWGIADALGYGEWFIPRYKHSMLDDHIPFIERGIPAIDIIDFDYPYWHTTEDTIDKVSPASLERVGRVLEAYLESGGVYPASP